MGFFDKLKKINIFASFGSELTDDFYDELEESLILADTGMDTTLELVEELRRRVREEHIKTVEEARECMCRVIADAMTVGEPTLNLSTKPAVVLFIGVNGVGKTTTIGKIGHQLKSERKKVLLCAADTFRAAAAEQLTIWAERSGVEIIIGVTNDKQFGPMLLVGMGGVFVEIFRDAALYPVPLNHWEAKEMLKKLLVVQHGLQTVNPHMELISNQELVAIQINWYRDGHFSPKVTDLYNEVYKRAMPFENMQYQERLLLEQVCAEYPQDYHIINDLVSLHKSKTLLMNNNGLQGDIERRLDNLINETR